MIKYNQFLNEAKIKDENTSNSSILNEVKICEIEDKILSKKGYTVEKYNSDVELILKVTKRFKHQSSVKIKPYVRFVEYYGDGLKKLNNQAESTIISKVKNHVNVSLMNINVYKNILKDSTKYLKFINDVDYIMTEFADKFGPPTQAREEGSARHEYSYQNDTLFCIIWLDFFIDVLDAHNMVIEKLNKLRKRTAYKLTSYEQNKRSFDENTSICLTMEI